MLARTWVWQSDTVQQYSYSKSSLLCAAYSHSSANPAQ